MLFGLHENLFKAYDQEMTRLYNQLVNLLTTDEQTMVGELPNGHVIVIRLSSGIYAATICLYGHTTSFSDVFAQPWVARVWVEDKAIMLSRGLSIDAADYNSPSMDRHWS